MYNFLNFRSLFKNSVTVKDITEFNLKSCQFDEDVVIVKTLMDEQNFDIFPVRNQDGFIESYVKRKKMSKGICADCTIPISPTDLISDSTPLIDLLDVMRDRFYVFVISKNKINGIVTRADLQKIPVRIFLFGMVNLLEMQFLRLINKFYPNESWTRYISGNRLSAIEKLNTQRKKHNSEIKLADCLQLGDKNSLILKRDGLLNKINVELSKKSFEKMLNAIERLRNNLVHAQKDILKKHSGWNMLDLVPKIEELIEKCEKVK